MTDGPHAFVSVNRFSTVAKQQHKRACQQGSSDLRRSQAQPGEGQQI